MNLEQINTEITRLENIINENLLTITTKQNENINHNNYIIQLQAQKKQLTRDDCKTIDELNNKLDNEYQKDILNRIVTDREYSKIYLNSYVPNPDRTGKKKTLIGTVHILGTFNTKKQAREEYEIKLYENDPKSVFFCSCADHKSNSTKKNIMCKHISFLICKVAKILKPSVFQNKKLSDEDMAVMIAKLSGNDSIWKDTDITKLKITLEFFKQFDKKIDDCCPLCYNDLTDEDKPQLLACPTCKNYIHIECADIWLERNNTCTFCKSKVWEQYKNISNDIIV